jgi:hypothetical protein
MLMTVKAARDRLGRHSSHSPCGLYLRYQHLPGADSCLERIAGIETRCFPVALFHQRSRREGPVERSRRIDGHLVGLPVQ